MNGNRHVFSLDDSVTALPGVGKKRAEFLAKLEINTIEDLLRHYPRGYEDRRVTVPVAALKDGEAALVRVRAQNIVSAPGFARKGSAKRIPSKISCNDESGEMTLLFFNARQLAYVFKPGEEYWVYGTPRRDFFGVSMAHPDFEPVVGNAGEPGPVGDGEGRGIVPVYPLSAGLTQRMMRLLTLSAIPSAELLPETLPAEILTERKLAPLPFSLKNIHYPEDEHALNAARYRLVYEEFFSLQYSLLSSRADGERGKAGDGEITCASTAFADDAVSALPFELTAAQRRVVKEICADMERPVPMRRLLQGDVGSGKTAVAAVAAIVSVKSGFQAAIMAPTEILAAQHFKELENMFQSVGIRTGLLTSGLSAPEKRRVKEGLQSGDIHVAIGTHALIEPDIAFSNLGLVVTDEQHRFGVRQRLALREKGRDPDTLVLTATPIPRTLAMMLYADLDLSALDEMPAGRQKVSTWFINPSKRDAAYGFAEKEISAGRQVYVVAPAIKADLGDDEDEQEQEQEQNIASAEGLYDELTKLFPERRVAMLHGKMKSEQKEGVMSAFADGAIDLLVSTVVIEVGVNVPNASVMIVENAERFGLAQLHQLRGRVGRGEAKSYCILISDTEQGPAYERLTTLAKEHDGFRIAELDLKLRGPGDLFGVRQHGLPEFKIADPAKHMDILLQANADAKRIVGQEAAE